MDGFFPISLQKCLLSMLAQHGMAEALEEELAPLMGSEEIRFY